MNAITQADLLKDAATVGYTWIGDSDRVALLFWDGTEHTFACDDVTEANWSALEQARTLATVTGSVGATHITSRADGSVSLARWIREEQATS